MSEPTDPTKSATPELTGRVDKYEITGTLGKGAMGQVYRAHDTVLERDVALKVMSPQIADDVELKERILPYLRRVRELYAIPTILVSHDVFDVLTLCDEVVLMDEGRVRARGTPEDLLTRSGYGGAFFRGRFVSLRRRRHAIDRPRPAGRQEFNLQGGLAARGYRSVAFPTGRVARPSAR